jgi:hypothetical protein
MVEAGGDPDFREKPFCPQCCRELRAEHLHGHVAIVFEVVRQVDRGHAARADLALDSISIAQRRRDGREVSWLDGGHVEGVGDRRQNSVAKSASAIRLEEPSTTTTISKGFV